jgi:hypothetical protein
MEAETPSRQGTRPQWFIARDPKAAATISDPRHQRVLEAMLRETWTTKALAAYLGMGLNATHLLVKRLEALGLVCVAHSQPRRGRAVRHYHAVANGYFVPFAASSHASLEALYLAKDDFLRRQLVRALIRTEVKTDQDARAAGLSLYLTEDKDVNAHLGPGPGRRWETFDDGFAATFTHWEALELETAVAKQLQRELRDLIARYKRRTQVGARAFLVRAALAPLDS